MQDLSLVRLRVVRVCDSPWSFTCRFKSPYSTEIWVGTMGGSNLGVRGGCEIWRACFATEECQLCLKWCLGHEIRRKLGRLGCEGEHIFQWSLREIGWENYENWWLWKMATSDKILRLPRELGTLDGWVLWYPIIYVMVEMLKYATAMLHHSNPQKRERWNFVDSG
jgi:hypothetical protein